MIRRAIGLKVTVACAPVLAVVLVVSMLLAGATFEGDTSSRCGSPPAASFGTGKIAWPMPVGSYMLTSGYGPRWGAFHAGIDLAAPRGTPYYAAADGVVERAETASGFGWWIVVRHTIDGQQVDTVYGHSNIATFKVKAGDTVAAGQVLAEVGNEGGSTGPHLHFEVWPGGRFGGASTDPAGWLASNVREGDTTAVPVSQQTDSRSSAVDLRGQLPPRGTQATIPISDEQRGNAEAITATVKGRGLPLRAAVVAVATAMQESRLRVLDYGDQAGPDSRGLFQQRDPWGPLEVRMDPVGSTGLFLDRLTAFDWQAMALTAAAQKVQRSGFPDAYAKWEQQAMTLVAESAGVAPATGSLGPGAICSV